MLKRLALAAMLMVGAAPASALLYEGFAPGTSDFSSYSAGDFTIDLKFDRPYDLSGTPFQVMVYINDIPSAAYLTSYDVPYTQISPTEWTLTTELLHRGNYLTVVNKVGNFTVGLRQYFDAEANFIVTLSGAAMVPEPSTWAMMIGGFGLVGGMVRRRRLDTDAVAA